MQIIAVLLVVTVLAVMLALAACVALAALGVFGCLPKARRERIAAALLTRDPFDAWHRRPIRVIYDEFMIGFRGEMHVRR